jgi:sirohydrochlorin ferrochelatase
MTAAILPLLFVLSGFPNQISSLEGPVEPATEDPGSVRVLIMAHGGSDEWNESVHEAVLSLKRDTPTALAFGMADRTTLAAAVDSLDAQGVGRVAVVRLFMSGESVLPETLFLLGLSDQAPHSLHLGHGGDTGAPAGPIAHALELRTHEEGVIDSPEASRILANRALDASIDPRRESVILLAHGMGDEEANRRLLETLDGVAATLERAGFRAVQAAALREDWEAKRVAAEAAIRGFVNERSAAGDRVIVVPARLSGFGPYAEVLEGLEYVPTEGLLPHPMISDWLRRQAFRISCEAGWANPFGDCTSPTPIADDGR